MGVDISPDTLATILGAALLIGGALLAGPSTLSSLNQWLDDGNTPAIHEPIGTPDICDHVAMVIQTAYAAPPEIQLEYLKQGLSQVAILEAEVQRLAPKAAA